jgi:5-methylcytosine-specific restriction endonuclease McrA
MSYADYGDKLRDPRWQKFRLEVFTRDNFTCQKCQSTAKTLHAHHKYYQYGLEPWEYDIATVVTVCEDCHYSANDLRHDLQMQVAKLNLKAQLALLVAVADLCDHAPSDLAVSFIEQMATEARKAGNEARNH